MNEISCEVIQDLIKGCADGTASRATVKLTLPIGKSVPQPAQR